MKTHQDDSSLWAVKPTLIRFSIYGSLDFRLSTRRNVNGNTTQAVVVYCSRTHRPRQPVWAHLSHPGNLNSSSKGKKLCILCSLGRGQRAHMGLPEAGACNYLLAQPAEDHKWSDILIISFSSRMAHAGFLPSDSFWPGTCLNLLGRSAL